MEKESIRGVMVMSIKENILMAREMEKESISGKTKVRMMDNGAKTANMVKDYKFIQTTPDMLELGRTMNDTGRAYSLQLKALLKEEFGSKIDL